MVNFGLGLLLSISLLDFIKRKKILSPLSPSTHSSRTQREEEREREILAETQGNRC
jgi:hypothetical protein